MNCTRPRGRPLPRPTAPRDAPMHAPPRSLRSPPVGSSPPCSLLLLLRSVLSCALSSSSPPPALSSSPPVLCPLPGQPPLTHLNGYGCTNPNRARVGQVALAWLGKPGGDQGGASASLVAAAALKSGGGVWGRRLSPPKGDAASATTATATAAITTTATATSAKATAAALRPPELLIRSNSVLVSAGVCGPREHEIRLAANVAKRANSCIGASSSAAAVGAAAAVAQPPTAPKPAAAATAFSTVSGAGESRTDEYASEDSYYSGSESGESGSEYEAHPSRPEDTLVPRLDAKGEHAVVALSGVSDPLVGGAGGSRAPTASTVSGDYFYQP